MGYIRETILRSRIPALLPAQLRAVDGEEKIRYDTAGKRPLAEAWEGRKLGANDLRALADAGNAMLQQCREHLLPAEGVVLDPARMYLDETGRFFFIYETERTETRRDEMPLLADFLLPRLDRADPTAVLVGYDLYQRAAEQAGAAEIFRAIRREEDFTFREKAEPDITADTAAVTDVDRQLLLDAIFEEPEEAPRRRPRLRAPRLWQQRILIGVGMVIAAAFVVGLTAGDATIGAGCALIASAVGALLWLRRVKE